LIVIEICIEGTARMNMFIRLALAASLPVASSISMATAGTPGSSFQGTGEVPRHVTTVRLPEIHAPMAMPVVRDLSALLEVRREIMDEETVRARYGSVSLSADGSVTHQPASDALTRTILSAPGLSPYMLPQDDTRAPIPFPNSAALPTGIRHDWQPEPRIGINGG